MVETGLFSCGMGWWGVGVGGTGCRGLERGGRSVSVHEIKAERYSEQCKEEWGDVIVH